MPGSYVPVLVMLATAVIIALALVVGSAILGPKKPTRYKTLPYECGVTPVGSARDRFPVKFYLVAMLFILFDVETIFLFPWAVVYRPTTRALKAFSLIEMAAFVVILFVGYFYILGKRALDWDTAQQGEQLPVDPAVRKPRPSLRYGNESGPVRLPGRPADTGADVNRTA